MAEKKKCIIVDMDGTLADNRWRRQFEPKNDSGSWDEYHSKCLSDEPTDLVPIVNWLSKYIVIIISTARHEKFFHDTNSWIDENCKFNPYEIYSRPELCDQKSPEVKKQHLMCINDRFNPILAIDDRKDVCEMFESQGIPTINYKISSEELLELKTDDISNDPESILLEAAELFKTKNKEYDSAYLKHGKVMSGHFPDGVTLKTEDDFVKFQIFVLDVAKNNRISSYFERHEDHLDSWNDKIVYAAIASSLISKKEVK